MPTDSDPKAQAKAKREAATAAATAAEHRARQIRLLAGGLFGAVVVALVLVIALGGSGGRDPVKSDGKLLGVSETKTLLAGIPQNGLALGKPTAPLTVLEFVDVQCPICRDHQLDDQPAVIGNLVRTGKIQLKLQPLAFLGTDSERGRKVLLHLAGQNKAWEFVNLFYFNQGTERTGYATDEYLKKLVAGIPGTKPADAAVTSGPKDVAEAKAIDAAFDEQAKKAEALGVPSSQFGTPWFAVAKTGAPTKDFAPIVLAGGNNAGDIQDAVEKLLK